MNFFFVKTNLSLGDAENDKVAIVYTSKLAEIPGMTAHVFEPANAQPVVDSAHLEGWKNKNRAASSHRIRKGDLTMFRGITHLIRDELEKGTLFGRGTGVRRSLGVESLSLRKKILMDEEEQEKEAAKMAENDKNDILRKFSHVEPLIRGSQSRRPSQSNSYFLPNLTKRFSTTKDFEVKRTLVDVL